jgi:flagellin
LKVQGLSIATNLLAINAQYSLDKNQQMLRHSAAQLSSGLRINSAADDPSGLAIATNLQTKVDGFNQASANVQTAGNAVAVAEGALQTQTEILQRIRDIAVQASSDVQSSGDRQNLQAEVSQLLLELNRISQNTNFNGQPLLDGSHAGFQPEQDAYFNVTSNSVLAAGGGTPVVNGVNNGFLIASISTFGSSVTNYFNTTPGGAYSGVFGLGGSSGDQATVDGTIKLQVINTGASIAVQETFIDSATGLVTVSSTLFGPSAASSTYQNILCTLTGGAGPTGFDNVVVMLGSISAADVGVTAYVKVSQNVPATTALNAPALTIQSGADEGDVVQVSIAATNAQTLRVSNINVALTSAADPTIGAEDTIGQVDNALNTLLKQRADLGAVMVRLQEDAANDDNAAVNLQASESSIRDLNVGQATTEFTKEQVLGQVGTSVLAQSNANAQSVLALFR